MAELREVQDLEISLLQPNPLQPRGSIQPETLVDLVDSIREHGIIEPLVVAKTPAGYQIIAGERRWRASRLAGLKTVPCLVKETTPQGMLEMAIVENVQRVDLNAIERAQAFIRLMEEFHLSNAEIAKRVGKSPAYVSNSIRLLSLPDALKDGLISGQITEGHARALAAIDNHQEMIEAYKMILRESASVRRAEEIARRKKVATGQKTKTHSALLVQKDIDDIRETLFRSISNLGCDPKVKVTRSRIETRVSFILKGGPDETEAALQKIYKGIAQ